MPNPGQAMEFRHETMTVSFKAMVFRYEAMTVLVKTMAFRYDAMTVSGKAMVSRYETMAVLGKAMEFDTVYTIKVATKRSEVLKTSDLSLQCIN